MDFVDGRIRSSANPSLAPSEVLRRVATHLDRGLPEIMPADVREGLARLVSDVEEMERALFNSIVRGAPAVLPYNDPTRSATPDLFDGKRA